MLTQAFIFFLAVFLTPSVRADDDVCSYDAYESSSWVSSGASGWLEKWFKDHDYDEHKWLNKMDVETTGNGDGNSVLDCTGLYSSGTCGAPETQCKYFTPNEYFFVRQMSAQFNQYMTVAHEQLQDDTIQGILSLDQMISDLDVYNRNEDFINGLLNTFVGCELNMTPNDDFFLLTGTFPVSTIGGTMAAGTGGANAFGLIGGVLVSVASNNVPDVPSESDIKLKMEKWLSDYFSASRDRLSKITNRMFGGNEVDSESDVLDELLGQIHALGVDTSGYQSKISQVLSSGAVLESISDSDITNSMKNGYKMMRMDDGDKYCSGYGDRYIDGNCFMLYNPDKTRHAKPVKADVLNKLEYTYGIDPVALYKNVDACDNEFEDGWNNRIDLTPDENGYTPCFFNMVIERVWEKDCLKNNLDKVPNWFRGISTDLACPKGAS